jgi:hypothetical protein
MGMGANEWSKSNVRTYVPTYPGVVKLRYCSRYGYTAPCSPAARQTANQNIHTLSITYYSQKYNEEGRGESKASINHSGKISFFFLFFLFLCSVEEVSNINKTKHGLLHFHATSTVGNYQDIDHQEAQGRRVLYGSTTQLLLRTDTIQVHTTQIFTAAMSRLRRHKHTPQRTKINNPTLNPGKRLHFFMPSNKMGESL